MMRRSPEPKQLRKRGPTSKRSPARARDQEFCSLAFKLEERNGKTREVVGAAVHARTGVPDSGFILRIGRKTLRTQRARQMLAAASVAAEAAGHPIRCTLLLTMLSGPATYRSLQKATGRSPGPLYHHLNQLRLARMIRPKERDLYELTRGGRNLVLLLLGAAGSLADDRPRPVPGVSTAPRRKA